MTLNVNGMFTHASGSNSAGRSTTGQTPSFKEFLHNQIKGMADVQPLGQTHGKKPEDINFINYESGMDSYLA